MIGSGSLDHQLVPYQASKHSSLALGFRAGQSWIDCMTCWYKRNQSRPWCSEEVISSFNQDSPPLNVEQVSQNVDSWPADVSVLLEGAVPNSAYKCLQA